MVKTGDKKIAMVTGAGRGLGKATAELLALEGKSIVAADVDGNSAKNVAEALSKHIDTQAVTVDVSDSADVERLVETAVSRFGRIDILVHCAGIARGKTQKGESGWLPMEEVSDADWHQVLEINLSGTFFVNRAVGRVMIRHKWGRIINTASISGIIANKGLAGLGPYSASKGGIITLTKVLAVEWAKYNITVNCISPSYMATEMGMRSQTIPGFKELQLEMTPMGRLGAPEEFAQVVSFLASEGSSYVTGHNLLLDGGYTAW
jgi:NAD(P)-dependent dehydrogenase (short-subunit alcohol dehydrogenase family)